MERLHALTNQEKEHEGTRRDQETKNRNIFPQRCSSIDQLSTGVGIPETDEQIYNTRNLIFRGE